VRKVGILALGGKSTGGIYQYTQSIIDALKDEKLNSYIVFCETSDDRFDNYGLEIRKIDKPNISTIKKTIRAVQHMFFIRKSYFFTKKELDIFDDIAKNPYNTTYDIKPYKSNIKYQYRLRVGDYRVIMDIFDNKLKIHVIELGHRKNIYKK